MGAAPRRSARSSARLEAFPTPSPRWPASRWAWLGWGGCWGWRVVAGGRGAAPVLLTPPRLIRRRRLGRRSRPASRQVLLHVQQAAFTGALDDLEERLHARHLFKLLGDEPLQAVLGDVIA